MAKYSKYVSCAVCPQKFHFKDGFMKDGRRASQDPDMVDVMEMAAGGGIMGSFAKAGIKSLGGIPILYCSIRCVQSIHGGSGGQVQHQAPQVQHIQVKEVIKEVPVKLDPIVEKTKELQDKQNPTTAKELKKDFTSVQSLFGLPDPDWNITKKAERKLELNKTIVSKLKSYFDLWTLEYSSEDDYEKVADLFQSKIKEFESQIEDYYSKHEELAAGEEKGVMMIVGGLIIGALLLFMFG